MFAETCLYESVESLPVMPSLLSPVLDLWQVNDFLRVLRFPPPIRLNATILLKVIPLILRGLTTLAKERRLDFSLRGQEREVKA
jgi:hypothetical protein